MLDTITSYFASLSPGWLYFALFVSAFVENIFPPVPGDTVTVFGAYIVGRSQRGFAGVYISTTLGSILGFMTYYAIGRLIPADFFVRRKIRFLPASSIETAGRWFGKWGYWIILLNRFLSGIRSVISIVCGMYRLPWPRVLVLSSIGCSAWNLMLIWVGYLLGANWRMIDRILGQYSRVLLGAGIVLVAVWFMRRKVLSSRAPR